MTYGAVLQTSPKPMQIVGYEYDNGEHGKRREVYRKNVTLTEYRRIVRHIKQQSNNNRICDELLFKAFLDKSKG